MITALHTLPGAAEVGPSRSATATGSWSICAFRPFVEAQLYQPNYRPSYDLPFGCASAMSTETSILDFVASVKITPLTGGTSP